MNISPRLVAGAAAAVVVTLALAGCGSGSTTAKPTATKTSSPTASAPSAVASSTPVATPSSTAAAKGGLSFAEGAKLSAKVAKAPQFLNGFAITTSGWTASSKTDTSSGQYAYTSSDGLCTATLGQFLADGSKFDVKKGDDETSSINALVWYFSGVPTLAKQVKTVSTSTQLPLGVTWKSGEPGVDFQGVSGSTKTGGEFATYTRVFTKPGVALLSELNCSTTAGFQQHAQEALVDSTVAER